MGSPAQPAIYSTPAFELFRRGLVTQSVQRFRGINAYSTFPTLGPEWAQDLINVIVSGSGGLSKFRLPVILSPLAQLQFGGPIINPTTGPDSFWDFQQGNGTRQVVCVFGDSIVVFANDLTLEFPPTVGGASGTQLVTEAGLVGAGKWSFVTANNILFGANGVILRKYTGNVNPVPAAQGWFLWGLFAPTTPPGAPVTSAGNLSPATGYTFNYAWKNASTQHVSNVGGLSPSTGAQTNKQFQVDATYVLPEPGNNSASLSPQTDTVVWFRNLDGGGDQFRLAEVNLYTGAVTTFVSGAIVTASQVGGVGLFRRIVDNTPDSSLDQTTRGPLINSPPLVGKYVALGQSRVFIFNLVGSPQDIIYSGYEQIYIGRPEECFPPGNRLRLSIGAEQIAGGGVLQSGIVAFSQTGRMYMFRGQAEDITLSSPVNFSAYLEELPWTLGCASHFTIMITPYGLVWLAGDKTVQLFDGRSEPIDISPGVYPYLRRITPGTEGNCVAAYFNWLERDWYVLLAAVDGSLTNNRIFMFAFNKQVGSDQVESVETFISDLPATLPGAIPWVGLLTTSKLQRMLCISAQGRIQQLPISSDTVNGITQDYTIIPVTTGNLNAFWRGGYFGNDSPQRSKMWRWLRLISDQNPQSFKMTMRYVDDEQRTFVQPEIIGPTRMKTSKLGLGHRAKRFSPEINFPATDAPANVLELQVAQISTADR